MNQAIKQIQSKVDLQKKHLDHIRSEMSKVIVGQETLIHRLLIAILTKQHILLEGVPGLAKTTAIATLAKTTNLDFKRIQFTPDLLPSDLIGNRVFNPKTIDFFVKKGPIFANFILADEINRSPAKVQSALLEAMQEKQVTIGEETFAIPEPFLVMATQNPIEQEGTYPLPEAQIDRFLLKTIIDYPSQDQEIEILNLSEVNQTNPVSKVVTKKQLLELQSLSQSIYLDDTIKKYLTDIVFASRSPQTYNLDHLANLIAYGASPRASLGLMYAAKATALLDGRAYVTPDDIKTIAPDILRHRIIPTYEAQAENITSQELINQLLDSIPVP